METYDEIMKRWEEGVLISDGYVSCLYKNGKIKVNKKITDKDKKKARIIITVEGNISVDQMANLLNLTMYNSYERRYKWLKEK